MSTCQQALEQWNKLDCDKFSPLCSPCITPSEECAPFKCIKKCPCGTPGCKPCAKHCPAGEVPGPCLPFLQGEDPATGCCFWLPPPPPPVCGEPPAPPCPPCFGPECPGQCPDGTPPPCLIPVVCETCPDGTIPEPPDCPCSQLCADGSKPPCPVTKCAPCPNGSIPAAPECFCPCPPGEHKPPCLPGEAPDLGSGCCAPEPPTCDAGEYAPGSSGCETGDSLDPKTGCCEPGIKCVVVQVQVPYPNEKICLGGGPLATLPGILAIAASHGYPVIQTIPFNCASGIPGVCG